MVESNSLPIVSLVVPVYNEAAQLAEVLKKIDEIELPMRKQIIIVDDCSSDQSKEIIDHFPFKNPVIRHYQTQNQGKGAAIRAGFRLATGEFIGVQDADFEYTVKDLPTLLAPLLSDDADVVYGSRFKKSGSQVHRTFHYLVNRFLTTLSNFCSGLYLTDMETCYKIFKRDLIEHMVLESNRFGFEPEVTAKIAKLKIRVHELPISYFPRNYMEGKKITWKDGVAAIFHILKFNYCRSIETSFSSKLPKKYIPGSGHWL